MVSLNEFRAVAQQQMVSGPSQDKTAVGVSESGTVGTHKWQILGQREGGYKADALRARQQLYSALTTALSAKGYDIRGALPDSVRKALKLGDFKLDKGGNVTSCRPLTARRIMAITTAIGNLAPAAVGNRLPAEVRNCPLLQPALKPKPMSPEMMKEFKACIGKSSDHAMRQAVKGGGPMGFGGDSLRCGTNGKMFARTSVNGKTYGANDGYDKSVFEGVENWGSHSPVLTTSGKPNPNAPFYGHLAALVPKDDPNRDTIMLMVTSQIGLQGLSGDLSSPEIMYGDKNQSRDWGFGGLPDISYVPNKLVSAGFGSHPAFVGSRDISLEGNDIVVTQKAHFGPQVTSIDNKPVGSDGSACDVPVYDVTKTIRIPLGQPKVEAGSMPQYTCDIDVVPHAE